MKKFNFNLKFLDRFRKNKSENENVEADESEQEEFQEDSQVDDSQYARKEIEDTTNESYNDDNPEEFAEKTLSNYNLEKFREENQHLINDNHSEDATDHNINFEELDPPSKPSLASKFKINFPNLKANFSRDNLKNRFSKENTIGKINKFDWNEIVLRLFSPYSRNKVHTFFIVFLIAILTYVFGKSIALFINRSTPIVASVKSNISMPIEKADTTSQDVSKITASNLFNIKESDRAEDKKPIKDISSIVCDDAEKPTAEQVKLLDTIVLQDSVKSVASVQFRGGSELLNVRQGEQIGDTIEVAKINRMKIILKNLTNGECEYVASEEEDVPLSTPMQILSPKAGRKLFKSTNPSIKNVGNNFKIKRIFRDNMINNMSEVLTQAKAIQITNPDGSLAFKMTEVVPGSIYSQLNIQNDDIITSINGKKIENLNELMTLLGRIKEIDQFQIGLKRNGINENLEYGFE